MAERKGSLFRRLLRSAERFSERAMLRGSSREKTPGSRSRALLVWVTRRDQRLAARLGMFIHLSCRSKRRNREPFLFERRPGLHSPGREEMSRRMSGREFLAQ